MAERCGNLCLRVTFAHQSGAKPHRKRQEKSVGATTQTSYLLVLIVDPSSHFRDFIIANTFTKSSCGLVFLFVFFFLCLKSVQIENKTSKIDP